MAFIGAKPTNVPLTSADIQDGTVALADLSATGTKDATTFLRGDNTFASAGSPSITDNGNATAITIDSSENVSIAQNLSFNSGFGSATTVYGCRAWINFTQSGTQTINGSGGVSSITDQGDGSTDVNFSTNMPDTNYAQCLALANGLLSTASQQFPITVPDAINVGYASIASRQCDNDNNTFISADGGKIFCSFFR